MKAGFAICAKCGRASVPLDIYATTEMWLTKIGEVNKVEPRRNGFLDHQHTMVNFGRCMSTRCNHLMSEKEVKNLSDTWFIKEID